MIVQIETDKRKPLEQNIQELILRKLNIKVDEELILINKEDALSLLLLDIISIACCDYDFEKAFLFRRKIQEGYNKPKAMILADFEDIVAEFAIEIKAYQFYFNISEDEFTEDEIYLEVLSILNSEFDLLQKKLHDLMIESLSKKFSEKDATPIGVDRIALLDVFANQVKLIATNNTIEDAVEEAYREFDDYPDKHLVKKEAIKNEFERFALLAKDEINTYKMAFSMNNQNAEFSAILALVKQLLRLHNE